MPIHLPPISRRELLAQSVSASNFVLTPFVLTARPAAAHEPAAQGWTSTMPGASPMRWTSGTTCSTTKAGFVRA